MDEGKQQKSEKQQSEALNNFECSPPTLIQGCSNKAEYFQLFDPNRVSQAAHSHHIEATLVKELKEIYSIDYENQRFIEEMELSISYQSVNYEVIKLNLAYGGFRTYFFIINVEDVSRSEDLPHVSSGNFGSIYEAYFRSRRYAIKKTTIKEGKFQQTIKAVLRELFILKIASALKIGPFSDSIYGFDLVIYANCIEFSMEFCDQYNQVQSRNPSELMNKLYLLHKFHILHNDIKPENISYSQSYRDYIFIDFGLSKIVKQAIGEKTMTSFVGSLQYCSPEMSSLFADNCANYINLYRNDALALTKSLQFIKETTDSWIYVQEQYARYEYGFRKFKKFQHLTFFKSLLFKTSMASCPNIHKQICCMEKMYIDRQEITNFLLCIPYNQLLIELYESYCGAKGQDDILKMFLVRKNSEYFENISILLVERVQILSSQQFQLYSHDDQTKNSSSNKNIDQCTLKLLKLIKINGEQDGLQEKIQACIHYERLRCLSFIRVKDKPSFYKAVVQFILIQSLEGFNMNEADILKQCIQTVIILEIVSQQKLKETFKTIIRAGISFIKTVGICLEFLIALQFTKDRLKSTYDYDKLTEIFMIELNTYLDGKASETLSQQEWNILYRMKQIIMKKIDYALQTFENKSPLSNAVDFHFNFFAKSDEERLLHDIETYLVCTQTLRLLSQNKLVHTSNVRYIKHEVIKTHQGSGHFGYLHLVLFEESYLKREDSLNGLYYHLFQTQLSPFPEHKQFKTYFKSIFCRVRRAKMTPYSEVEQPIINTSNHVNLAADSNLLKEIQQITNSSNDIHFCIKTLQTMTYLFDKRYDFNYIINRIIAKNRDKIFLISKVHHKDSIHQHNNKQRLYIDIASLTIVRENLYKLNQNASLVYQRFINQNRVVVNDNRCFQCKTMCLFQLKLIQAQWLMANKLKQQSLNVFLQCFEMCLKYKELNHEFSHAFCRLTTFISNQSLHLQEYSIFSFAYYMAKSLNDFSCCFIQLGQNCFLIFIYQTILLEDNYREIIDFVTNILRFIMNQHSAQLINIFYYNFQSFIKSITDDQQRISFRQFHNDVISEILLDKQSKQMPLLAMYFCLLLLIKINGPFNYILFKFITKSLNKIHHYAKGLILGRYFFTFSFYFDFSKRKIESLRLKHYKHCIQKTFSLQKLMKDRIKVKRPEKIGRPFKELKLAIKRYHFAIGNVRLL